MAIHPLAAMIDGKGKEIKLKANNNQKRGHYNTRIYFPGGGPPSLCSNEMGGPNHNMLGVPIKNPEAPIFNNVLDFPASPPRFLHLSHKALCN